MNRGELKTLVRLLVPGAKERTVEDTELETLLNLVVADIASRSRAYKKSVDFTVTENQSTYNISTIASDYVAPDESGLWWKDSNSEWVELDPMTKKSMDIEFPNWRNDSSGDPQRYFIESDTLEVHNIPDTTLSSGFRLFYAGKPVKMTQDTHCPFHKPNNQTVEIPMFVVFDDCIIAGVEWWITKALSKKESEVVTLAQQTYYSLIMEKTHMLQRRPDILHSSDTLFKGQIL